MNDNYWERLVRSIEDLNSNISRVADKNESIERMLSNIEEQLARINEKL